MRKSTQFTICSDIVILSQDIIASYISELRGDDGTTDDIHASSPTSEGVPCGEPRLSLHHSTWLRHYVHGGRKVNVY